MNKLFKSLSLVVLLALGAGCQTTQPNPNPAFNLKNAAMVLETSTYLGSFYVIKNNPDNRKFIVVGRDVLSAAINTTNLEVNALAKSLSEAVGQTNQEVVVVMQTALTVYKVSFGDGISAGLASNEVAIVLVTAVRDGLNLGLAQSPPQISHTVARPYYLKIQ